MTPRERAKEWAKEVIRKGEHKPHYWLAREISDALYEIDALKAEIEKLTTKQKEK